jgi:hypothetical protein
MKCHMSEPGPDYLWKDANGSGVVAGVTNTCEYHTEMCKHIAKRSPFKRRGNTV